MRKLDTHERQTAEPRLAASKPRGGRGAVSGVDFTLDRFLDEYEPRSCDRWQEVGPFVIGCMRQAEANSYSRAHRMLRALTMLTEQCVAQGVPLDVEQILTPSRVEHLVATTLERNSNAAGYRSDLRYLGQLLTRRAPWAPRPKYGRRTPAMSYDRREITVLDRACAAQSTELRRQAATALFLLGIGAGLDGRWAARIRPNDVRRSARDRIVIDVPDPHHRVVPVQQPYADRLIELATSTTTECLVGKASKAPHRASSIAQALVWPRDVDRMDLGRLRATWIVTHLVTGTRLHHLLHMAGMATASTFGPYLDEARRIDPYPFGPP